MRVDDEADTGGIQLFGGDPVCGDSVFQPAGVVEKETCLFGEVVDLLLPWGCSVVCCFRFLSVPTCDFGGFVAPCTGCPFCLFVLCFLVLLGF